MSSANIVDLRPGKRPVRANPNQGSLFQKEPRRPLPLRARRRRVRAAQLLGLLLVLAALGYGLHYLSYLPQLQIASITVDGAETLPPQLVSEYVDSLVHDGSYHFLSRSNIFLYPSSVIEKDVVAFFPRTFFAQVERPSLFSRTLLVHIKEREPYATWCDMDCYVMDEGGFIYAHAQDVSSTLAETYRFSGGISTSSNPIGQRFIPGHLPGLLALLASVAQQAGLTPQSIVVADTQDFTVHFAEGFDLKASFGAQAETLARNFKLVLNSDALSGKQNQIEYIDLRFGDRVFYKLKGQEQQSTQ